VSGRCSEQLHKLKASLDEVAEKLLRISNELGAIIMDLEVEKRVVEPSSLTVADVQVTLGAELNKELKFSQREDAVIVTPKRWLGRELFNQIAEKLRTLGAGEYVPAGKQSHWIVRKHE